MRTRGIQGTARRAPTISVVGMVACGILLLVSGSGSAAGGPAQSPAASAPSPEDLTARLREAASLDQRAWERLSYLCDRVGARLAGTTAFAEAVKWSESVFREDRHESVRIEPVRVGLWVRGRERLVTTAPFFRELPVLGIGESVGTPGLEAPVVVCHSLEDLGPHVAGKVVLFNPPVPPAAGSGERYGIFARFRVRGASEAAGHGAAAVLVRSIPVNSLATPHTGTLIYDDKKPKIPAASITAEDSEWIDRLSKQGVQVRVRLEMEAHDAGDVDTSNVVAEIRGSERPEEIVLLGAHLDSWDVGQGAHDDGVGVIHVIEAMRLIRSLGVAPKRTIRAVLFANEEHGTEGGNEYAVAHEKEQHVAAIESDAGGGEPLSWGASGTPQQLAWFLTAAPPAGLAVEFGGGGVDIGPLMQKGILGIGLRADNARYFDVHHTHADTLDSVEPAKLLDGLTTVTLLTWQLANAPSP